MKSQGGILLPATRWPGDRSSFKCDVKVSLCEFFERGAERSAEPLMGDEMGNGRFTGRTLLAVAASCLIVGIAITASLNLVPLTKATTTQLWSEKRENGRFSTSQISDGKIWVRLAKELTPSVVNISTTQVDRKSTRLNSSHIQKSRMPSSA